MVKTRRKNYDTAETNLEGNGEKWTKTNTEALENTRDDGDNWDTMVVISSKALQEILVESQHYVSPPRPTLGTLTVTAGTTYQHTPVTYWLATQPRFGAPAFRYAHLYVSTTTATVTTLTPSTSTLISSTVKVETATGDSFEINDGMVIVSYTRLATNLNQWEPVRITLFQFKDRSMNKPTQTGKRVTFADEEMKKLETEALKLTADEEEFMRKVEEWVAWDKKSTDWRATDNYDDEPQVNRKRYDKTVAERTFRLVTGVVTMTVEHRLAIVRNLQKLPATEFLMGADNYDGWNTKMKRFFAAFDMTEYIEKPLYSINETDKIKGQLDAAILLAIHGNISTELQQVVNNETHAFEALETLCKLYTGNTVQELINIGGKLLELSFSLVTPVPTFFAEAEAGFLRLHRIGFTVPERIKCTFLSQKLYPKLPAITASITALPDKQISVKYIQEKVTKVVDLLARNGHELGETGDPRPTGINWTQRQTQANLRRQQYSEATSKDRKYTSGSGRGMTIGDSRGGSYTTGVKKCLRCFATDHDVDSCPKPDMRRCYTLNLTGHISRNCPQYGKRVKAINTIIKNKFELRPILDTGTAISLIPETKYLK